MATRHLTPMSLTASTGTSQSAAVATTAPEPRLLQVRRRPYHLSQEQVRFFDESGYLILPGLIGGELLRRLQDAGDDWIAQGLAPDAKTRPDADDFRFAKRTTGEVFFRVDYLHGKRRAESLELLGSPEVLGVAESLCGPNFVPTYESMVFKQKGDGEQIPWHQDAVQPRSRRVFNFDLYLEHSRKGGGALRVIPGTHLSRRDVCDVADRYGWDAPGAIDVEMAPGDVLLHDAMVIHGSARAQGNALRRTIYYEFRSVEQILSDGPWDRAWIDRRLRLIALGLRRHAASFPAAEKFRWNVNRDYRPTMTDDEATELRIAHVVHTAGTFCSAGNASGSAT
jgi:ectoine hydroxylase-related dioxygenase (phytanoyl-CoA dioxygenase family)